MKDRITDTPGRVLITPEDGGAPYYATVTRADNPSQVGDPLSKATLLKDSTAILLGLDTDAVPDDAFAKLALGAGKYGYLITLVDPADRPMAGFTISGVETITGEAAVTDEDGSVLAVSTSQSVTVSVASPYFDLKSVSQTVQSTGIITSVKLVMTAKYSENQVVTLSSSVSTQFSSYVDEFDVCAIGAGGGGAYAAGGGGGGGYIANLLAHKVQHGVTYNFAVGAGGNGATTAASQIGSAGGDSSVTEDGTTILQAEGGRGGGYTGNRSDGGAGNGDGGAGAKASADSNGKAAAGYLFNDSSLGIPGGGGGGGGRNANVTASVAGTGGTPYGGAGSSNYSYAGDSGSGPGGGGGGGATSISSGSGPGGDGANGAIKLRMRYAA